jgi:formate hydrogenlyase subunit 4
MKKTTLILALALAVQNLSAHPGDANHHHDSFISEWGWVLIPCVILFALIWKFGKKSFSSTK